MKIIFRLLAGLIGGTVGGMGMGGGTLLIPILTIFLSFTQLQAQGINLIGFIPMSVVALIIHSKNHLVKYKDSWLLAVCGAIISFFSALIATSLKNVVLKKLFAVFLIILGIWQTVEVIKIFIKKKKEKDKKQNK
ncbi:MAG: sulfite exporter TauE/SafE family protein [Clostridia bacterium]|nr:sulfite exporter TauE/SafE family protein [Clostridia bacterium]